MKNECTNSKPVFRTPYTTRLRVGIDTGTKGGAKQEFRDECEINNIMRRYQRTGIIEHARKYQGSYADVTGAVDYQTAQNIIIKANEAFDSLPSRVRAKFQNSPAEFLEFVNNPENIAEMRSLGLCKPEPKQAEAPTAPTAEKPPNKTKPVVKAKEPPQDFDPSD